MKPQLSIGQYAEVEITVTSEMMACFEDSVVHELYSTSSLVHHMEWAARKVIAPCLQEHEEAMGSHVEVSHLAMTLPGMRVKVRATVKEIRDRKVICEVEAYNTRGKIARGTVTQSVVDKTWLDRKRKEFCIINELAYFNEVASRTG